MLSPVHTTAMAQRAAIRNAERKRVSTCKFADTLARAAIAEFHAQTESGLFEGQQTVLAAIAVKDGEEGLQVRSQ